MLCFLFAVINCFTKFIKYLQEKFPLIYYVTDEVREKYPFVKIIIAFLWGTLWGFCFYKFIIYDFIDFKYGNIILIITLPILLGIGCALAIQVRCIILLISMAIFGKTGRSLLKAIVFGLIISGPVNNVVLNSQEVVRAFSCSAELSYNLTKTRFDLLRSPFHEALLELKENITDIKEIFGNVANVIEPLVNEVEGDDNFDELKLVTESKNTKKRNVPEDEIKDATFYQERYVKKIEKRCKEQLKKGQERCELVFSNAYDKCQEQLPAIIDTLFCWPMKIDFICNLDEMLSIGQGEKEICDASQVISPKFGENYVKLKEHERTLMSSINSTNINYKIIPDQSGIKAAQEIKENIVENLNKKKQQFDSVLEFLQILDIFICIKIVIGTIYYHSKYLKKIDYDNIYITDYFEKIDKRRLSRGHHNLLPLKKVEKCQLIYPKSKQWIEKDYRNIVGHIIKLILEIMAASLFIVFDWLFYTALDLVARHARVDFVQEGVFNINVTITGDGLMADIVRNAISGMNSENKIKKNESNQECLPNPTKTSKLYYMKIYGAFLVMFVMIYNEIFIKRINRSICAYFYPKREKQRILFLYNETLKNRRNHFHYLLNSVLIKVKENNLKEEDDYLVKFQNYCPTICNYLLKICPVLNRRKCTTCNEAEGNQDESFTQCTNPSCKLFYCQDCWFDMGEICVGCFQLSDCFETILITD